MKDESLNATSGIEGTLRAVGRDVLVLVSITAFAVSALLTGFVRRLALRGGVLDVPNARSSHSEPTPRGGGAAIVLTTTTALIVLGLCGTLPVRPLIALAGGGLFVALVGFIDDRRSVPAGIRLAVHFGAALWALIWLGGAPAVRIGDHVIELGWWGNLAEMVGIVWVLNLFNFMDGIDGIAASEAVFISCSGAVLFVIHGNSTEIPAIGLTLGAAVLGFLIWNWPPAKIFMGDVGSGYLGYVISVVAIAAARDMPAALWVWLILGGIFLADATVTLWRRALRGERLYEAHRSHAYQRLARRWKSHRRVTVVVTAVNLAWLLPCALIATLYPDAGIWIAAGAMVPLVLAALMLGSGQRDSDS